MINQTGFAQVPCGSPKSRTDLESTVRASAQCLATVWKAEKMLSPIHTTGYGRRTQNLKFASPVKHWIWSMSLKRTFQRKVIMLKAYKQHTKDWDFLMILSCRTLSTYQCSKSAQSHVLLSWDPDFPRAVQAQIFVSSKYDKKIKFSLWKN